MPKLTGPCFSLAASKTLGKTLTYQKRPSGSAVYLRSEPGGRAPYTLSPKQQAQRNVIAARVTSWQALDQATKDSWDEAAKSAGIVGTGYHYFMHGGKIALAPEEGPTGPARLLETGEYRLLETGAYRLLE